MAVNRIDLLHHKFSKVLRGYSVEEVDALMQEVADAMGRLGDEKVRLGNRVTELEERIQEFVVRESALRDTLVASQKMGDEIKTAAQKEAQLILEAAQARAENVYRQAESKLARLIEEISEAKKLKAQFEFQVRAVIEGHLRLLELGQLEVDPLDQARSALSCPPVMGLDDDRR